jgi:Ca2+-binding EF-hand superfamily protein
MFAVVKSGRKKNLAAKLFFLMFCFRVYDKDGAGFITTGEHFENIPDD